VVDGDAFVVGQRSPVTAIGSSLLILAVAPPAAGYWPLGPALRCWG
jgi:hypothetical protein